MTGDKKNFIDEAYIKRVLESNTPPSRKRALGFLEDQQWVRINKTLVSKDAYLEDKLQATFEGLSEQDKNTLALKTPHASEIGAGLPPGWFITIDARAAGEFFARNRLKLQTNERSR